MINISFGRIESCFKHLKISDWYIAYQPGKIEIKVVIDISEDEFLLLKMMYPVGYDNLYVENCYNEFQLVVCETQENLDISKIKDYINNLSVKFLEDKKSFQKKLIKEITEQIESQ